MAGGQGNDPVSGDIPNSMGAVGGQVVRASNILPFPHIAAAMVHAYKAEVLLHEIDSGPHGGDLLLAGSQAHVQDAMKRLGMICANLSVGKDHLGAYLAACGVYIEGHHTEDTTQYTKVLGALAQMPETRAVIERAQGFAADIAAWTQRAKNQYPHSIPPPDMLGELYTIAGYYGQPAEEFPGPEQTPDTDTG